MIAAATDWCPRCFRDMPRDSVDCPACGLAFRRVGGVLDVLGAQPRESKAAEVESFYTAAPFPGYAPSDDAVSLLERSRRSSFLCSLDEAVPTDGRFLSVGCGTAQVPAFLALSGPKRRVVGIDGCSASLQVADRFAASIALENLCLVRGDLFDLPVEAASFDLVSCRGVVHHTPDPYGAIDRVARCVAPGGTLILGFYETLARGWHRTRRRLANLRGQVPIAALDPILRRRDLGAEKKRIWIEDQYRHPLEHILPLPRVLDFLERQGFDYVRTVPPSPQAGLLDSTPRPSSLALLRRRLGWMVGGLTDPDAGLVILVVRRRQERDAGPLPKETP